MQDAEGQVNETESVSAGLDYPAVGPEHCLLKDTGRAKYVAAEDADEAIDEARDKILRSYPAAKIHGVSVKEEVRK